MLIPYCYVSLWLFAHSLCGFSSCRLLLLIKIKFNVLTWLEIDEAHKGHPAECWFCQSQVWLWHCCVTGRKDGQLVGWCEVNANTQRNFDWGASSYKVDLFAGLKITLNSSHFSLRIFMKSRQKSEDKNNTMQKLAEKCKIKKKIMYKLLWKTLPSPA